MLPGLAKAILGTKLFPVVYILKNVMGSSILWKCHLFLYTVDKYCCRKKNHIRRDTSIISRKWSIVLYIHVHVFECLHQRRVQKYHLGTCILLKYACANVTVLTWHCLNKYSLLNDVRFNDQVSIIMHVISFISIELSGWITIICGGSY